MVARYRTLWLPIDGSGGATLSGCLPLVARMRGRTSERTGGRLVGRTDARTIGRM